jgi:DNA helicase-2/ATP-dependent DNA helicase PcrA
LFRTNEQPRAFELEFRRAQVPYILVGGLSFYDRKEVRDIMAYLRVLAHPNDEVSLLRIINTPSRGISAAAIQVLLERAVQAGRPLWSTLPGAGEAPIGSHVVERIQRFVRLIDELRSRLGSSTLTALASEVIERIGYRTELERLYAEAGEVEGRWEAVEELVNSIALYERRAEAPSLLGFLEEAALAARDGKAEDPDERRPHAVTLMTLHSAKGLEFRHIYLVGMEEGLLPHKRSVMEGGISEERRLCYVGVTRAQDTLTLSYCKARMKWGKAHASIPSRFLMEMRGDTERARRAAEAAEKQFCTPAASPPATDEENGVSVQRDGPTRIGLERSAVEKRRRARRRALP